MKLERVHADKAESLRRWCWTLELISVLGAIAAFSAGPKQKFWITAGLALLLLSFLLRWSVAGHLGRLTPLDVPWALLLVGALVGLWASYDVSLSLPVLLMLVASVSLYHVVVNAPQPRALAQVAVVAGLTAGAYFLAQYQYTGFQDKGVLASWLGRTISGWFPRLGWWSPSPNGVASLLEGLVPLALGLAITGRSWVWRIVGGVPAAVMALALVVTASRGAWVALAVGMVLWLASRWRAGLVTLAVGVPIVAVALALTKGTDLTHVPGIGPVLHELFARPDRLEVYRGSLRLIQDFPLTGIGLGEVFALVYSKYVLLIQVPFLT
jgi:O-antigen ligase